MNSKLMKVMGKTYNNISSFCLCTLLENYMIKQLFEKQNF